MKPGSKEWLEARVAEHKRELIYDGTLTAWLELGRSDNGA